MSENKDRKYTDKQLNFLEALSDPVNNGDIKLCMNIAGYGETISPSVIINSLREEIVEVTLKILAANSTKAAVKLVDLLDKPNNLNAKTILATSKEILDRAGAVSKQKEEIDNNRREVIVILPEKIKK